MLPIPSLSPVCILVNQMKTSSMMLYSVSQRMFNIHIGNTSVTSSCATLCHKFLYCHFVCHQFVSWSTSSIMFYSMSQRMFYIHVSNSSVTSSRVSKRCANRFNDNRVILFYYSPGRDDYRESYWKQNSDGYRPEAK